MLRCAFRFNHGRTLRRSTGSASAIDSVQVRARRCLRGDPARRDGGVHRSSARARAQLLLCSLLLGSMIQRGFARLEESTSARCACADRRAHMRSWPGEHHPPRQRRQNIGDAEPPAATAARFQKQRSRWCGGLIIECSCPTDTTRVTPLAEGGHNPRRQRAAHRNRARSAHKSAVSCVLDEPTSALRSAARETSGRDASCAQRTAHDHPRLAIGWKIGIVGFAIRSL
jgi:hypothetical protein